MKIPPPAFFAMSMNGCTPSVPKSGLTVIASQWNDVKCASAYALAVSQSRSPCRDDRPEEVDPSATS
jgi:hypothetical protein